MYVGIDVGGSKVLLGTLTNQGVIKQSLKVPTPPNYREFLESVKTTLASFDHQDFKAAGVAIPATKINRDEGVGVAFGNLPWRNVPIQADIEKIARCPVVVENDAKLACLSEAKLIPQYRKVLYITISTGIGAGLVVDGKINPHITDGGGRTMLMEHGGKIMPWETFASGKAIVERFGRRASDITDEETWAHIAHDLSLGFMELIAICEPDVIVVGGSVGTYFERLKPHLRRALKDLETPMLKVPPMRKAQRPEEAVLYGCYDLAKEVYGNRH